MTASTSPDVKVILLDIEGTVCPISFVKDVLFPYALRVLPETLEAQWDHPDFAKYKDAFPPEYRKSKEELAAHVRDLMNRDVKIAYLKNLQGYLWEEGYAAGHLKAPLFPDVPNKLSAWHHNGLKIMIYSSGSVPAQKLLFKHTDAEPSNLTPLISNWFDTVNAGLKTEPKSYQMIADTHAEIPAEQWLFLSDNTKEVEAAIAAGMQSMVVRRPGNPELPAEAIGRFLTIDTFDQLAGVKV
ncbi:putative enolase-phosphatase E1 [Rosellinia necatrix]|uniref:Enolase-phosphatase E1 n=1 Tax=Rosellinia necatrix TaxID=77044 RepID=A0A1W2TH66_ROSNE|nr:putative enolase-phosphatase E1 [Rosellinia necatrix]